MTDNIIEMIYLDLSRRPISGNGLQFTVIKTSRFFHYVHGTVVVEESIHGLRVYTRMKNLSNEMRIQDSLIKIGPTR